MKRRDFVQGAGGLSAALVSACGSSDKGGPAAHTRDRVQWRLASSFPRSVDVIFGAAEHLASQVERMSGGRFRIHVYPAGELVPGLQVMDAVQQGTVEVGHTASYYYIGKHPALAFETSVPFGLTARQQQAWLAEGGGGELLAPLYADFNIRRFPGGNTGTQMGGWFNREIAAARDLKGLKMRIPGPGGEVMTRLGATVQVLSGGDIYPALERGAIDATEWIGPYDDEKLGFHKIAKFYYYPGFWEPGPSLVFMIGEKAWGALPSEYQAMFEAAAASASARMLAQYDARNPQALVRLRKAGVQFRAFPRDLLALAKRTAEALMHDSAAKDPTYRKIYQHFIRFRRRANDWFALAEQHYAALAFGSEALLDEEGGEQTDQAKTKEL